MNRSNGSNTSPGHEEEHLMGLLDMLFGRKKADAREPDRPISFGEGPMRLGGGQAAQMPRDENELALERYRYMLRTAPPETIEQAHAEAFERMTPEQRAYVLQALANELPQSEGATADLKDDPRAMARVATRAEMRNPGVMERTLSAHPAQGAMGGGMMAGMAGTLMMSFAMGFVGSMAATAFLDAMGDPFAAEELMPEEMASEELAVGEEGFDGGFADFGGFDEF
jgi:hypothetical protein